MVMVEYSVVTEVQNDKIISRYYHNGKELDYLDDIPHAVGSIQDAHKFILSRREYGYVGRLETLVNVNE